MRPTRSGGALLPVIIIGASLGNVASSVAHAQAQPTLQPGPSTQPVFVPSPAIVETQSATWPLALGVHALIGVEPHDRGNPVAFGAGMELLWRGTLGGFAELLASEGTPVIPPSSSTMAQPSFGDRISVPFGFAARPLAPIGLKRRTYWGRLLTGIGLQIGITVEHLRTSDDEQTTAGLHLGLGVDIPLFGGTREGGIALRLYGRLLFTPSVTLDAMKVYEPVASGQLFAGISYYP